MERIGIVELRQNTGRYLDKVKAGEGIEVTERGRLIALLVPPDAAALARERTLLPAAARGSRGDRRSAGSRTADALAELREDR